MDPAATKVIRPVLPDDRRPLSRMLELYQYELSDIWDQDLDDSGEYGYSLDRYFQASRCKAFVALVSGKFAGFALADGAVKLGTAGNWMDQFFILKKYRRAGLGAELACTVFRALPGYWEVGQMRDNLAAQAFWRRVISAHTTGAYTEHSLSSGWWQGVIQSFTQPQSDA